MLFTVLRVLSPFFYLLSAIYFFKFFSNRNLKDLQRGNTLDVLAIVLHFLFLVSLTLESGHPPLAGAFQAMSTFMLFFAILSKVIAPDSKDYSIGFFNTSLLFVLQLISVVNISPSTVLPDILKNVYFEVHVILNLIGYASFSSAFLLSFMYLLLFYEIKGNQLGYFYDRLPSLAYLEKLNRRAIIVGFVFSTLGIFSGAFTGMYAWGQFWAWDPKLVSATHCLVSLWSSNYRQLQIWVARKENSLYQFSKFFVDNFLNVGYNAVFFRYSFFCLTE